MTKKDQDINTAIDDKYETISHLLGFDIAKQTLPIYT